MTDQPNPTEENAPPKPNALWLWRFCLMLPFFYLLIAYAIDRLWFRSRGGFGFWPLEKEDYQLLMIAFAALAGAIQGLSLYLRKYFGEKIRDAKVKPREHAQLVYRRTVWQAICADTVCGLGLVAFLFNAHWNTLIGFCIFSYFLYAQAFPQESA